MESGLHLDICDSQVCHLLKRLLLTTKRPAVKIEHDNDNDC